MSKKTVYQVVKPLVIAKGPEGQDLYVYHGGFVPDGQTDEWIDQHVDEEMIVEVSADAAAAAQAQAADGGSSDEGGGDAGELPKANASTDEWRAYAVANGVPEAEAADLSRNELRDRFA